MLKASKSSKVPFGVKTGSDSSDVSFRFKGSWEAKPPKNEF